MIRAKPLRILHVVGAMNRGGVETWLMHVLRNTPRERLQHDFAVHTASPAAYDAEIRGLGSRIFPIPCYRNPLAYARELGAHLRRDGPYDVVHSHVHHFSGVVLRTASRYGVPRRIAHSHNDTRHQESSASLVRESYLRLGTYWIYKYATDLIAASREAAASFQTNSARPWSVLYCGHDFRAFQVTHDPAVVRQELGIPADALVIGHVGRFDPQKNHSFLLRVAAALSSIRKVWRLLLVGDGPLREAIVRQAKELGIADNVIFAGVRTDVPRLLVGANDVFVFPSTHEGLPLSCTEAQAAGLPLVIADTITRELDLVPGAVTRLRLTDPPPLWAQACVDVFSMPRTPRSAALDLLSRSPFSISASLEALEELYCTGI